LTPERWAQIEELFHRAAEADPQHRTALLDRACSDDRELRREVEVLLSCEGASRDHVQEALRAEIESVGFPLAGETISHYPILDGLRGGGMDLVYRAEDIRLARQVTIKFLPLPGPVGLRGRLPSPCCKSSLLARRLPGGGRRFCGSRARSLTVIFRWRSLSGFAGVSPSWRTSADLPRIVSPSA
jgi:hypothetical protein